MLTWNVTYHCKPGKREEFFKAIDALLLVETWQTPEDQQRHCGTETFAKLQALKTEFCDTVTIDKFDY